MWTDKRQIGPTGLHRSVVQDFWAPARGRVTLSGSLDAPNSDLHVVRNGRRIGDFISRGGKSLPALKGACMLIPAEANGRVDRRRMTPTPYRSLRSHHPVRRLGCAVVEDHDQTASGHPPWLLGHPPQTGASLLHASPLDGHLLHGRGDLHRRPLARGVVAEVRTRARLGRLADYEAGREGESTQGQPGRRAPHSDPAEQTPRG
jgi:hypothetical protein